MDRPFLRPEAVAWLRRWRETLAATGAALLGLWWFLTAGPILSWAGAALAIAGVAAAYGALQRARFRPPAGGVGVVQLDEGRLTYFGPLTGGSVALRDLVSVTLDPRHRPPHWILRDGKTELAIPVDAEGADALFDAFAQLPGLDPASASHLIAQAEGAPRTLWRREGGSPQVRRLR